MENITNVSYLVIPTDGEDQAASMAYYLNEHGVCAFVQKDFEVSCPLENLEAYSQVELLKKTWRMFWEYSDSGLFGLPMYVKD